MMDLATIRETITDLSGSGKRVVPSTRKNGIYSTFTLEGLDDMKAVRDTVERFDNFQVPADLTGKTVLDLGSNVGTMSFEANRRGAAVTGVEFREDRVSLCRIIQRYYNITNMEWHEADFNDLKPDVWIRPHDIVICCSVDEYINDRHAFYQMLGDLTKETLYFECNVQRGQSVDMTILLLVAAGFKYENVTHLGSGHSGGISRKRIIYKATK